MRLVKDEWAQHLSPVLKLLRVFEKTGPGTGGQASLFKNFLLF